MKNYLKLTRVMMKNESMDMPASKKKRIIITILGIIAVFAIFIPMCVLVGAISFIMTTAVRAAGGDIQGLAFILMFVAGFSIVFGMSVILNVFYFSNDMNYLLPFPLQPWEIIGSKFTVSYINESVMEFIIILSAMIGYMMASKVSLVAVFMTLFGMITVPIIPLVYCGIICIILMTFTGIIKNKDSVHKIMGVATMLLVIAAFVSVSAVGGMDIDNYAKSLADNGNPLYGILSAMFVHIELICKAMTGDIISFILYIAINLVALTVFLVIAQKLYFKGVVGIGAYKGKSGAEIDVIVKKHVKVSSTKMSYLKKEFKMLLRTPAFLMNCVLINFLWPALMYAVYMLWGSSDSFEILLNDYRNGNEKMLVYVPVLVIIISIIVTAANSIASSSVTREGTGYIFMKYIPMTIREQISVKALVSIIISYGCLALYIVVGCVVIDIKASTTIYYLVLSFMGVVFVTYMGVLLDTVNPKLLWDDEINALRGNSTIFFGMAYAMILGVILLGLAYVLLEFTSLEITIINLIIVVFMIIMDIFTYVNCMNTCQDNMEE